MTGSCPACGHEVSVMATDCPNCGHGPLAGHYLRGMHLSPAERAKRDEDMAKGLGLLILVGLGVVASMVLIAIGLGIWEWLSQIQYAALFAPVGRVLAFCIKWLLIIGGIFLPLGLTSGFLAKSSGRTFGWGFWWGQLSGPVGLIYVVSRPSNETFEAEDTFETYYGQMVFSCPKCHKKYDVTGIKGDTRIRCDRCQTASVVRSDHAENDIPLDD